MQNPEDKALMKNLALIIELSQRHLDTDVEALEDLEITNISGMSNLTFKVGLSERHLAHKHMREKIVVRIYQSATGDCEMEAKIFNEMSRKGRGPKEIEGNEKYRVEQFIDGRPLTMFELRNPYIAKTILGMICETNYDTDLHSMIGNIRGFDSNLSRDFLYHSKGWYNRYLNDRRPILKALDLTQYPRAQKIFNYFETFVEEQDDQ